MRMMKCFGILAFSLALVGCDAAKEPMAKARDAEAAGKLAEAKTLYGDVCKANEKSPFCAVAKQHIESLALREALAAIAEGNVAKVKEQAASITGGSAKRAYDALGKTKAMSVWAGFEEANMLADKSAARVKMEELAGASSPVADKAKEWLSKNAPALLLAEVTAACKPDGTGSCLELGAKIVKAYPSSAEGREAQALVDTEYKRLYPALKQAEGLLVQRLEVYNWKAKSDLCMQLAEPSPGGYELQACNTSIGVPEDRGDPFNTDFLEKAWKKKLDEVRDPGRIKELEARWDKIASSGIYDPANLPKPGDKPAAKK